MKPAELLTEVKNAIGRRLLLLKAASQSPDNYPGELLEMTREKLSLELRWRAKLYRLHPELRPKIRSRQMRLPI